MNLAFIKFFKFCVVGGIGVFIDFGVTYLLKEIVKINRYIANSIGFLTAATCNYFLNRTWTFHSENPSISTEYLCFIGIALAGLLINNAMLYVFSEKTTFPVKIIETNPKYKFYFSKLLAIGIVTLWNFFMNYFITFAN